MKVKFTIIRIDPVPVSELPKAEQEGWLYLGDGESVVSVGTRRTGGGDTYLEVIVQAVYDDGVIDYDDGVSDMGVESVPSDG